jgi:uncharacterized membrane protein
MNAVPGPTQEGPSSGPAPVFSATLTPHRSLGPKGFLILMSVLSVLSFGTGLAFAWTGAWPVLGFFGLDVLLVYLAFKLSYRSGRLYERVDVDRERLTLMRVHPSGRIERYEFPAYWVRVLLELLPDGRSDLRLTSHGRVVPLGRFLTNEERDSFAVALSAALQRARASGAA